MHERLAAMHHYRQILKEPAERFARLKRVCRYRAVGFAGAAGWPVLLTLMLAAATTTLGAAAALTEPAPRTTLSDSQARFTVPEKPYVLLRRGPLEAVVVDNRAVDDDVLPGHRAGYHGLGSLKHERQPRNLFVSSYAGLNFEHIHDGTVQDNQVLFQPPPEFAGQLGA